MSKCSNHIQVVEYNTTIKNESNHQYEVIVRDGYNLVVDYITGLTWQQSGVCLEYMNFYRAKQYIRHLNTYSFAYYSNWRLPTFKEAISLMELNHEDLYINKVFDMSQKQIWVDYKNSSLTAWVVDYYSGSYYEVGKENYYTCTRAVREGKIHE